MSFKARRIVVAAGPGGVKGEPYEEEKLFEERERLGVATPEEEVAHGRGIDPLAGLPRGVARGSWLATDTAAQPAIDSAGPGKGPVYGTKVHTEFKNQIRGLEDPKLSAEQSYLRGVRVPYGTKGSVRPDAVIGPKEGPSALGELKTGRAKLDAKRIEQLRIHVPKGRNVPVREIKP